MLVNTGWKDTPDSVGIYWCAGMVDGLYEIARVCELDQTLYVIFPGVDKMIAVKALKDSVSSWYGPITLADFMACKIFSNGLYGEEQTPVEPTEIKSKSKRKKK